MGLQGIPDRCGNRENLAAEPPLCSVTQSGQPARNGDETEDALSVAIPFPSLRSLTVAHRCSALTRIFRCVSGVRKPVGQRVVSGRPTEWRRRSRDVSVSLFVSILEDDAVKAPSLMVAFPRFPLPSRLGFPFTTVARPVCGQRCPKENSAVLRAFCGDPHALRKPLNVRNAHNANPIAINNTAMLAATNHGFSDD